LPGGLHQEPASEGQALSAAGLSKKKNAGAMAMTRRRFSGVLLQGIGWGMVGLVYAPLFIALLELFTLMGLGSWAYVPAAAFAGAAGAALYGSMPIAIIGTLTGIFSVSAYMMVLGGQIGLLRAAGVGGVFGTIVGIFVKFPARFSQGVPAKSIVGLLTGLTAGLLVSVSAVVFGDALDLRVAVAVLVAVNGILYVAAVRQLVGSIQSHLPRTLIEAVVCGVLSATAGAAIWLVGGPILRVVDPSYHQVINHILEQIPLAAVGGIIGGAIAGALLEAMGVKALHDSGVGST
jgi:hypothetical protein